MAQPFPRVFPVWEDRSPHSKPLVGSLYLEPRPSKARPELCCPLLGWPALSPCLSPPCFCFPLYEEEVLLVGSVKRVWLRRHETTDFLLLRTPER